MFCVKCDNDLAQCWCDDMPERLQEVKEVVLFGKEYLMRLEEQAERVSNKRAQEISTQE